MRTITLASKWTYRTPMKTVDYPPGEHEVTEEVARQAETEDVIEKESLNGAADRPAKPRATRAADPSEG